MMLLGVADENGKLRHHGSEKIEREEMMMKA
jgi:hypothetical protein